MRKWLIVLGLLVISGSLEINFSSEKMLSALPSNWVPEGWLESVTGVLPGFSKSEETLTAAPTLHVQPKIPLHKPLSELTSKELEVKLRLEQQLLNEMPSDVIVKRNGRRVEGRIIEESSRQVRLEQEFRGAGKMSTWIPRSSILF